MTIDFSWEILEVKYKANIFQMVKENKTKKQTKNPQNFVNIDHELNKGIPQKWRGNQDISDEGKLRELVANNTNLKE